MSLHSSSLCLSVHFFPLDFKPREVRDRSLESQQYRASSGLNLVTAAISLWNTVYLQKAIETINKGGKVIDENLLKHLSPLSWEHINLTGDYIWHSNRKAVKGKFPPLQTKYP